MGISEVNEAIGVGFSRLGRFAAKKVASGTVKMYNQAGRAYSVVSEINARSPLHGAGDRVGRRILAGMSEAAAARKAMMRPGKEVVEDVSEAVAREATGSSGVRFARKVGAGVGQGILWGGVGAVGVFAVADTVWDRGGRVRELAGLQHQAERDAYINYPGTTRTAGRTMMADGDLVFAAHNLHGTGKRGRY